MDQLNYIKAILLGLFQGLTEFLPVSSSGHIMILSEWLGVNLEGGLLGLFTILLHVGTLIAVLVCYRKTVWEMIRHPFKSDLRWLILATLPTVVYALILKFTGLDELLSDKVSRTLLPWAFFTTAILLYLADKFAEYHMADGSTHKAVKWHDALIMGLMQCVGTFVGVSRSGSTITGGLATGLTRKKVADFSFMMSIPAILGAALLDIMDMDSAATEALSTNIGPVLVGIAIATVAGVLAIRFMLFVIKKIHLKWFAIYVGLLGAAILVYDYYDSFLGFFK